MLDASIGPEFGFRYNNLPVGATVTPGASNAEGNWTQIASAANVAEDVYWMRVLVANAASAGRARNQLLDIGIDPAGGTSYVPFFENLVCGMSGPITAGFNCRDFQFPVRIPAGSTIAARIQGSDSTPGTANIYLELYGRPNRPEIARRGQFAETIGAITNSNGVIFTPGINAAKGAWTLLGTTTKTLWWWQVGVQIDDATLTAGALYVDLAYGDASNKDIIISDVIHITSSTNESIGNFLPSEGFKRVLAGSNIYIRGMVSIATADSNYNATAIGIGG